MFCVCVTEALEILEDLCVWALRLREERRGERGEG